MKNVENHIKFLHQHSDVLSDSIAKMKTLGKSILPDDGSLWLYGSRARGDYHEGSDWDLLILLNKEKQSWEDFDTYGYPFVAMGWEMGEVINPMIYTTKEWERRSFTPFYHNVEQDKILLV